MTITFQTIPARDLQFRVRRAGTSGEPVLMLHGFPECSAMWAPVMSVLAADGWQCAAPDQRGYSSSARPADIASYGHEELVADVFAIADELGWQSFHLIAHDWGACVAWLAAIAQPERLTSLTVLSIPHYQAFAKASWIDPAVDNYRRFLELAIAPHGAAERVFGRDDMAAFRSGWMHHAPAEIEETIALLSEPGALSGAFAWYRASDGHRRILPQPARPVHVPTLFIAGQNDPYVGQMAIDLGEEIATKDYRRIDFDAGHWLVQERPDEVIAAIRGHLERYRVGRSS